MPVYLAGETLPAGKLQNLGTTVQTYTPTLEAATANPTLGAGALQEGAWSRQGDLVVGAAYIQFGTSGVAAGTGIYFVGLPVPILDLGMLKVIVGSGHTVDVSAGDARVVSGYWLSSESPNRIRVMAEGASDLSSTAPWVWAASDQIAIGFTYPGAF